MGLFDIFKKPQKSALPPDLEAKMKAITMVLFPNGQRDIEEGGTTVRKLSRDKLTQSEAEKLFASVKSLLCISEDKSPERIKQSITMRTQGQLSSAETQAIYQFISGDAGDTPYGGGNGQTPETAVIINFTSTSQGIHAEYQYLEQHFGQRDKDWKVEMRGHGNQADRRIEWFAISFPSGEKRTIHFDITAFFGKF